ncbi:GNAT family N-acetyltransferase [Leptospira sp. WS92.C1]
MNIREVEINDLQEMSKLFDEYRQFYKQKSDLSGASKFLEERIRNKESKIFIVLEDQLYLGFTQLYPVFTSVSMKRAWILNDLYVRPEHRKKGAAKALIDRSVSLARSDGSKYLELSTATDNTNAQKLYESYGFVKDEEYFHYSLNV